MRIETYNINYRGQKTPGSDFHEYRDASIQLSGADGSKMMISFSKLRPFCSSQLRDEAKATNIIGVLDWLIKAEAEVDLSVNRDDGIQIDLPNRNGGSYISITNGK